MVKQGITMQRNSVFKLNVLRHQKMQSALNKHGLTLTNGVVVDSTLPYTMHQIVCPFDYKTIDLNKDVDLSQFPQIFDYIKGGRSEKIAKHIREQAEARDFIHASNSI